MIDGEKCMTLCCVMVCCVVLCCVVLCYVVLCCFALDCIASDRIVLSLILMHYPYLSSLHVSLLPPIFDMASYRFILTIELTH